MTTVPTTRWIRAATFSPALCLTAAPASRRVTARGGFHGAPDAICHPGLWLRRRHDGVWRRGGRPRAVAPPPPSLDVETFPSFLARARRFSPRTSLARHPQARRVGAAVCADARTTDPGTVRMAIAAADDGAGRAATARSAAGCDTRRVAVDHRAALGRGGCTAASHAGSIRPVLRVASTGAADVHGAGRAPARRRGEPQSDAVCVA